MERGMMNTLKIVAAVGAALLLFGAVSHASSYFTPKKDLPGIRGRVYSISTGEPIEGAVVHYTYADNMSSGKTLTDSNGEFSAYRLKQGEYTIRVEADGYETREEIIVMVLFKGQMTVLTAGGIAMMRKRPWILFWPLMMIAVGVLALAVVAILRSMRAENGVE